MTKRYVYYVAYMSIPGDGPRHMIGSCELYSTYPVTGIDAVRGIERDLSQQNQKKLLVTGISLLRTEDVPAERPAVPGGAR